MFSILLPAVFSVTLGDVTELGCPPYNSRYEITVGSITYVNIVNFSVNYETFEVILYPQGAEVIMCSGFEKEDSP